MPDASLAPFEPIADGVFVAVAEPAGVNIGLVVGTESALVVDTGSTPAQGAAILAAAEAVAGVPVAAAVVTHWHWDHWFGLAGFSGVAGYGHETLLAKLDDPALPALTAEMGISVSDVVAPDHPFALARVLDLGGRRVELVHFGRGHTDGDVVVIVPDANVIFAGDLLEQAGAPAFGPDSFLKEWPSAVDGILGLVDEDTTIVPGHGESVDRFFGFDQRARISGLWGQAEHLIKQGVKQEAAYEAGEWPFDEPVIREVLPLLYEQLAATGTVPRPTLKLL